MKLSRGLCVLPFLLLTCTLLAPCAPAQTRRARRATRPAASQPATLKAGTWGGRHIALRAGEDGGAQIEYDCGRGTVEGRLTLDRAGRFEWRGLDIQERGGPVREGIVEQGEDGRPPSPQGQPAIYKGRLVGRTLTLTVTLADTGEKLGTYSLALGREPEITRCY